MIVIIFNSFDILGTLLIVVCFCNAGLEAKQLFNSEQAHFESRDCTCTYTILVFQSKYILTVSGLSPQVQVWDTAGQERFRKSMVEHYYRNVHAVVFVYDVTKMTSFRNLQTWIEVGNSAQHLLFFSV